MAGGRAELLSRIGWSYTSELMALIANCNRDPKKQPRPFVANDFNPYAESDRPRRGVPITADNIDLLRVIVPGGE